MTEEVQLEKPKVDRFAKAREALAAKRAADKAAKEKAKEFSIIELQDEVEDTKFSMEEQVWLSGLTAAMRSREVKTPADVAVCIPVADAVLKAFAEKFPE